MGKRQDLGMMFKQIPGMKNVYFSPPSTKNMKYPCIIYKLKDIPIKKADNRNYISSIKIYDVTLIDSNPDNEFVDYILNLPISGGVTFINSFSANNMNHYNFQLCF